MEFSFFSLSFAVVAVLGLFGVILSAWILSLRRVVPANEVHIVQTSKGRVTYGKEMATSEDSPMHNLGNTYYEWPIWIPKFGVQVLVLPLTVFDQDLKDYDAYDNLRVPFKVDVKAFYRIENPALAAERISSMDDLKNQLLASLQGAIRSILAGSMIEQIMQGRSEFGEAFTKAVDGDLKEWGVKTVKSIELMDIQDANGSRVIHNIMAKRVSGIDKESRVVVAENMRAAESAEIDSKQAVQIRAQDSEQAVGLRKAEVKQRVGIANQQSEQEVQKAAKETETAKMDVKMVTDTRTAEIEKTVAITVAEQRRETSVIEAEAKKKTETLNAEANKVVVVTAAEADKERMVATADGQLALATNEAKGIELKGLAEGATLRAAAMAPVDAELALANGLGQEKDYQDFIVRRDSVQKDQAIGIAQAAALKEAEIKVIANTGSPAEGIKSVGELFSSSGGLKVASAIEGFMATPQGEELVTKLMSRVFSSSSKGQDDATSVS